MNPIYQKLLIAGLLFVLGMGAGYKWADADKQRVIADHEKSERLLAEANTAEIAKRTEAEHKLSNTLNELAIANQKVNANAKRQVDSLRTDIRSGAVRLSVPTKNCSITVAANPSAAAEPAGEARAELLPEFAERIIARAAQCDAEVRERNELMDRYNAVRDEFNNYGH